MSSASLTLTSPAWLRMRRYRRFVGAVNAREAALFELPEPRLLELGTALRHRVRCGDESDAAAIEAFALMREACRRTLGARHYDVQVLAAAALRERAIVEMQTGEGKTLTAALPLYYFGLRSRGAYLATSNDYLARRDADGLRPAFGLLGLSVDAVTADASPDARRAAYRCDVTYGTGKEFGFDFLRDRIRLDAGTDEPLQREPYFMLADEADNLLIDDAATPLIIATPPRPVSSATAARFRAAAAHAPQFRENVHYTFDAREKKAELTTGGRMLLRSLTYPPETKRIGWPTLYEDLERAIAARRTYHREVQYLVRDGAIVIVDESTGRIAEGRKWREGMHQAVEAQEQLAVTDDGGLAAHVSVQDFFRRFPVLAGMSGTVANSARELRSIYQAAVFNVPTHRPTRRTKLAPRIFTRAAEKLAAVVHEIHEMRRIGRPILVGTRSVERSTQLADLLRAERIEHVVLNAREAAREAAIVAQAGEAGRVTIATNMAGRGTDIRSGPGVAEAGGLHVVLTEMHQAARIDRQFIGRAARQGDPGSFRIFLSLEDELLAESLGVRRAERLRRRATGPELSETWFGLFAKAQRLAERRRFGQRKQLLEAERQRAKQAKEMGLDPYLDLPC